MASASTKSEPAHNNFRPAQGMTKYMRQTTKTTIARGLIQNRTIQTCGAIPKTAENYSIKEKTNARVNITTNVGNNWRSWIMAVTMSEVRFHISELQHVARLRSPLLNWHRGTQRLRRVNLVTGTNAGKQKRDLKMHRPAERGFRPGQREKAKM